MAWACPVATQGASPATTFGGVHPQKSGKSAALRCKSHVGEHGCCVHNPPRRQESVPRSSAAPQLYRAEACPARIAAVRETRSFESPVPPEGILQVTTRLIGQLFRTNGSAAEARNPSVDSHMSVSLMQNTVHEPAKPQVAPPSPHAGAPPDLSPLPPALGPATVPRYGQQVEEPRSDRRAAKESPGPTGVGCWVQRTPQQGVAEPRPAVPGPQLNMKASSNVPVPKCWERCNIG